MATAGIVTNKLLINYKGLRAAEDLFGGFIYLDVEPMDVLKGLEPGTLILG